MDEPGHPDDLKQALRNWLQQAQSPIGSLPEGTDPIDWAIARFIEYWERPARQAILNLERSLGKACELCDARADSQQIREEIEYGLQVLGEDLRTSLGLYDWNEAE